MTDTSVQELYRADQLPIFQNHVYSDPAQALACTKGDIDLVRDLKSGLIFNRSFRAELMTYDADYQNEQALSPTFRQHLDKVVDIIRRHFADRSLLEVGCGKGYFLEHLHEAGFSIRGVDPAYEGNNPLIVREKFRPSLDLAADGVILRHVLEHIQDPVSFLAEIRAANHCKGWIYIEVPCFDWICIHSAWYDIFYEHVNYFRPEDFLRMFGSTIECGHLFGGQYLYAIADLQTLKPPRLEHTDGFTFPPGFLAKVQDYTQHIVGDTQSRGKHVIVWGGSSKGVIFSLFLQRAGINIDFVVDINPAKQGRYLPGTGLRVWSPDEAMQKAHAGSTVFVTNGNYLSEIRTMTLDRFNYLTIDHE